MSTSSGNRTFLLNRTIPFIISGILLLLTISGSADAVVKDYYLNGGLGGAADHFSSGRHAWDAGRVQITDYYTVRRLRVKMRRVECEQTGSACTPDANRTHPYFNARIYTHDYIYDMPGVLVGSVSSNTINFNTDITTSTTNKYDKSIPFIDVWFNDLNAEVEPGLYWIVIHNVDWTNVYPNHLDHYIQLDATNIAPLGATSIYGRALSYTLGNAENTASWTEKYTGQLNYALYDDAGSSGPEYSVAPYLLSGNGTITPSTPQTVNEGTQAKFTITADSGYTASVGGTCGGTLSGTTFTTEPVYADCTVSATFSPVTVTHTVTPSAGTNGTITPSTPQTVNEGAQAKFTITADNGYTASVGGTCGGTLSGTTFTTEPVYADCTVSATFSPVTAIHTVTPSAGTNGTITPSTPQTVTDGQRVKFSVRPNKGYVALVGGTCGGRLIARTYTTNPVYSDCTVTARFVLRRSQ